MKIHLASDLHLEFGDVPVLKSDADVLILSGDICVADHLAKSEASPYFKYKQLYLDFFKRCADSFPRVLYVPGNHEHYHGRFDKTVDILREVVGEYATVMDNDTLTIDGVKFIGGTLWTNANGHDHITEHTVETRLNDYRVIHKFDGSHHRKLRMFDTLREFEKTLEYIDLQASPNEKCVVLTHHAPTPMSIGPKYQDEYHLNGGYASNLFDFIYDRPQIKLWTHGHVHYPFEYKVNETTVACNPKGYPQEGMPFNTSYVLEV